MLAAIGALLTAVLEPLRTMAGYLTATVPEYTAAMVAASNTPITDRAMSTNVFNVLGGPWVEAAGPLVSAGADFVEWGVGFMTTLKGLL
ncbi:MAG TPA: hypothetical protein VMW64_09315 [Dehalococcoidia bacterium]|nr:hypothetical protein [Dehalococcoidia bacterium]